MPCNAGENAPDLLIHLEVRCFSRRAGCAVVRGDEFWKVFFLFALSTAHMQAHYIIHSLCIISLVLLSVKNICH